MGASAPFLGGGGGKAATPPVRRTPRCYALQMRDFAQGDLMPSQGKVVRGPIRESGPTLR
jgi:hypothetical protein